MQNPNQILSKAVTAWKPPERLTVSEWSDAYRMLPSSSAEPGRWRTARAPYLREIMDSVNDPNVKEVWWMKSAQVGATEALNNICAYFIDIDPGPILVLQPTVEMGQSWSKDRFQPMLRDCPRLRLKVDDNKSRDSGNTITHKNFAGGSLDIAGANSPAGLASRPKRIILCDEVDRYPASAGAEGDPVALAAKRATTYWNRMFFACSTPTIKDVSRIEAGFESGDQCRYHVPCPHCGHEQTMEFDNLDFSDKGTIAEPVLICKGCSEPIRETAKPKMLAKGRWIAGAEFRNGIKSFHINELYSPWSTWGKIVSDFKSAVEIGTEAIKTWKNTSLGETFEVAGQSFESKEIASRAEREDWTEVLPDGVLVLTAGADVQRDRVELEIVGWGHGEESWSIDYQIFGGNTKHAEVWEKVEAHLGQRFNLPNGGFLRVVNACIDTGDGFSTDEVYSYAMQRNRGRLGWIPIKGASKFDAPIFQLPTRSKTNKTRPWILGVGQIKRMVYDYLSRKEPGAGFCHFPEGRPDSFYRGLTAEKLVTVRNKGFSRLEWHKQYARNEPLDCRTYAYAAMRILNPDWEALQSRMEKGSFSQKIAENPQKTAQNLAQSRKKIRIRGF